MSGKGEPIGHRRLQQSAVGERCVVYYVHRIHPQSSIQMCAWCFCSPVQHRPRPVPCSLTARDDQDGGAFPSPALQLHVLEVALEERQIMMRQSASTALISLAYLTTHITGRRGGLPVWSSPPCPASGIAPTCHSLPLTLYLSSDTADGGRVWNGCC